MGLDFDHDFVHICEKSRVKALPKLCPFLSYPVINIGNFDIMFLGLFSLVRYDSVYFTVLYYVKFLQDCHYF